MGTSLGRDVYEQIFRRRAAADKGTRLATQIGIAIAVIATVVLCWQYRDSLKGVIAKSTALFFALCASAFLPSYLLGLFWKRMNKAAAMSSIIVGFIFTAFWLTFMQGDTAKALGICEALMGRDSLVATQPWPVVDALVFALPLSFVVAVVVALATKPMSKAHMDRCFPKA